MPFKKGDPKPANSGRKKGAPNRATKTARQIMDAAGFNPIRRAMTLYNTTDDLSIKAAMLKLLVKHAYPELKAIEISGDPDKPIYLADAEARRRRIEELQARLMPQPTDIIVVDTE